MKVNITTLTNSFILNDIQYQKGALSINTDALPIIQIGTFKTKLSDITADGQTFANAQTFQDWASGSKMFASQGGGGSGNVNSVTGNLVTGTTANPIVSLSGSPMDIVTFDEDGNPEVKPIGITQLTDINGFPSFANGVFVATGMNATDKTGLLLFVEFSTNTPKTGTFPTYGANGVLKVSNAVSNGDAVALGQLLSDALTFTNKRITQRVNTVASGATITPVGDTSDIYTVTALAANATIASPSGTPTNGQQLLLRIKDNGTARTLTWNAIYRAGTDFALPTTTVISKTMYVQFIYNSVDTKWDAVGLTQGF